MKGKEVQIAVAAILAVVIAIVGVFLIILTRDTRMPQLSQEKMQENMEQAEKVTAAAIENAPDTEGYEEEEGYSKELTSFEAGAADAEAQTDGKKEDKTQEDQKKADAKKKDGEEEDAEENQEYLCSYSSDRLLTEEDIEEFNSKSYGNLPSGKSIIQMVINEMYARYGYQFQTQEIQAYFDGKEWYQDISVRNPDMDNIFKNMTDMEKANVEFLSAHNTEG